MGIFLVRKPKCKPPSNRSSVLLLYLCIFCKNWFGTIELILDSIIDNDNWWQHVRCVCYYDCPQICWLLVSTSLNPSKKPRQDIAMPGTGGNILTSHNFLISLQWDFLLCLCAQNMMYLKTFWCLKLAVAKIPCYSFEWHSPLEWRVRYLFCPAHDKMYDDTGLDTALL